MSGDPVSDKQRSRRVEPVVEDGPSGKVREDGESTRRGLAVWLALGPVLSAAGFLGWLRLIAGLRPAFEHEFSLGALAMDTGLVLQFALSHSLLARGFGRRLLNRPFGPAAERPLYVLVSGLSLCLLVLAWQSSGPLIWEWSGGARVIPWLVQLSGLALVGWSAVVIGTGAILGLPHLRAIESGGPDPQTEFTALPPYAFIRQPVNAGLLLLLLGMPTVTADLLLMGLSFTIWILLAAPYEERDLEIEFEGYTSYRERTPRWFPRRSGKER